MLHVFWIMLRMDLGRRKMSTNRHAKQKQEEMKLKSHMIELRINLNYFLKGSSLFTLRSFWHCQS